MTNQATQTPKDWFLAQFTPPLTSEELRRLESSADLLRDSVQLMVASGRITQARALVLTSKKILGRR